MVAIRKMHECANGNHEKCTGGVPTQPGTFGGTICDCSCHKKKALEREENKDIYCPPAAPKVLGDRS